MNRFLLPLGLFGVLIAFLAVGLTRDPREVPSPLIGKPAADFSVPRLDDPAKTFGPKDLLGKVWLLNAWSTWCVACRQEHRTLVDYSKNAGVTIVGLNYKEVRGDAMIDMKSVTPDDELKLAARRADAWLNQHGNPYQIVAMDIDGRVGINYGVYGVPETYLIDKAGIIRYKQIGPVTPEVMDKKLLPLIKELEK